VTSNDGAQGGVNVGARKPGYFEFKAALLEFSDAPTPATLVRYLNASRALERLDPLLPRPALRRRRGAPEDRQVSVAERARTN
jgi:hypothetical protein